MIDEIPEDMVDELEARLDEAGVELRQLGDWASPFDAAVAAGRWVVLTVAWLVTLGSFDKGPSDYWMQVNSSIYVPRDDSTDLTVPSVYLRVCHEIAHRHDWMRYGSRYAVWYLLSGDVRARAEYRAYGMEVVAERRVAGGVRPWWPDYVAAALSGGGYFWATDFEEARETMQHIVGVVQDGDLGDLYDPEEAMPPIPPLFDEVSDG